MRERRSEAAYWIFGVVSVVMHAGMLFFFWFGAELFSREPIPEFQPVELMEMPEGVQDPLAPQEPEPQPEEAQPPEPEPEPEPEIQPEPEPEVQPEPEPPKNEDMPEPERPKNIKKPTPQPTPKATPKATPKSTPKPTPKSTPKATPKAQASPRPTSKPAPAATPKGPLEHTFAVRPRQGVPGGSKVSGAIGYDSAFSGFAWYVKSLEVKFSNVIIVPPAAFGTGKKFKTKIYFVVGKNGKLLESRIEQSSGSAMVDEAAMRSVQVMDFPPLPVTYRDMEAHFSFTFNIGN